MADNGIRQPVFGDAPAKEPAHIRGYNSAVGMLGRNPKAVLYGILILIIAILAFALYRCHKSQKAGFEGLTAAPPCPAGPPCPPSFGPPELDSGGGLGSDPTGKLSGRGCPPWDPEATAEVQALGQVGGFEDDNAYGERRLQNAFGHVITDEQLNTIMHEQ